MSVIKKSSQINGEWTDWLDTDSCVRCWGTGSESTFTLDNRGRVAGFGSKRCTKCNGSGKASPGELLRRSLEEANNIIAAEKALGGQDENGIHEHWSIRP